MPIPAGFSFYFISAKTARPSLIRPQPHENGAPEMKLLLNLCSLFIVFLLINYGVSIASDDSVQIIKIADDAQSALIKQKNGKMKVVHVGDKIENFGTLQNITKDRVSMKTAQGEVVIISLQNGKPTVQRIQKLPPRSQNLLTTITSTNDTGKAAGASVGRKDK
ncbi:MAG: hypothetical protein M0036_16345 [Desulfobacteraceae bacterium]|nr:hypothetical protein [Desulfobacteraceae bacterium]